MRGRTLAAVCSTVLALMFAQSAVAGSKNPADYPLRVRIYTHNSHSHYWNGGLSHVDGEGRANLFENSIPTAFEFNYECGTRLMNSVAYETYMARWKKHGSQLEVLVPATGATCVMKINMKPGIAFRVHNGHLEEEPSATLADWMKRHHYDPEHGQDLPQDPENTGDDGHGQ